ncbi:hypothetical protein ACH4E8_02020 [Streptomyces sp. NPDC017979]|uniref:hypothetical protein n=1 Tax=Streptomyces sp. NPDC017979 TaxID=3365024 RepID=UPI0037BBE8A3
MPANPRAVFLMRQFTRGVPDEPFEAAKIDGASERPVRGTVGIPCPLAFGPHQRHLTGSIATTGLKS